MRTDSDVRIDSWRATAIGKALKRTDDDAGVRRFCAALSCLILLLISSVNSAWAVDPATLISQYAHTAWRTSDGTLNHPNTVTQTADGYVWVYTADGLMRFDGVRFKMWVPPKGRASPTGVTFLLGARDGSLWIATSRGLLCFKKDELLDYSPQFAGAGANVIIEDHQGNIWFTRYRIRDGTGPLCRIEGKQIHCYGTKDGISARYGLGLAEDSAGNIWFGSNVLYRWTPSSTATYFEEETKHTGGDGVPNLTSGPSGSVWAGLDGVGAKSGLRRYSEGQWSSYVVPGLEGANTRIEDLFMDRNHSLWMGVQSEGIYRIHDGVAQHYGSPEGLTGKSPDLFYEDREGGLWVVTEGGLDLFRDRPVITFASSEGVRGMSINAILALRNGSVWVSDTGALEVINGVGVSTMTAGHGLPGQDPEGMFEDRSGRVWIGIDDRIMVYTKGHFAEIQTANGQPLGHIGVANGFAQDSYDNLWALTYLKGTGQYRLLRIQGKRVQESISLNHLFHTVRFLAADKVGGVWITGDSGELVRLRDGRFEMFHLSIRDPTFVIYSLFIDATDNVWVSTNRGLFHWKEGHLSVIDSRSGLPCSAIYSAIADDHGNFWLYAKCGLLQISASNLRAWLISPNAKISTKIFDHLDGALTNSPPTLQPQNAKSADGRLWFMTDSRVQMIDPLRSHPNPQPPPVYLEELTADHKNYDVREVVTVPHLHGELQIDYTAPVLTVPQRVQFRYKLEGHDAEWQDPGIRRQAFYTDLGPGNYRFQVIAASNDVWNMDGASLNFRIAPTWYQTIWFRISIAVAVLGLLCALYRYRIHLVAQQFDMRLEERLSERTRIARELHDTLLQSFHGLLFRFQAARNLLSNRPEEAVETLDRAILGAEEALAEGRSAIQGLRPEPAAIQHLAHILSTMGQEMETTEVGNSADRHPPVFQLTEEGERRNLSPVLQDEICRIAREVLRNAFRHADARQIETEIRYDEYLLRLRIRDDGKGLDSRVLLHGGLAGHWGLPGIRERAEQIGARLNFWSEAGAGTEVELTVPASVAYEKSRKASGAPRFGLFRKKTRIDEPNSSRFG